ncbi:MAG TPA: hypothetical protein VKV04_15455 [Verrucomicrobiae bacterium]|nr:hypothetical protein [Verrucomicrobiae bacterium]
MKSDNLLRHIWVPFLIAVLVYVFFYTGIEHRRTRKGPWEVAFTNNAAGTPTLVINQPSLTISNLQITFPGESNALASQNATVELSQPRDVPYPVPFGKCVFMDTTFLPGTIVFDLFGHEIQLIPRALRIDGKEIPWQSNATIPVAGTNAMEMQRR